MFLGKGVLKFTGEHQCRSAISLKLLCNFIEITLRHECSTVNLLHIFRTSLFFKTPMGGCFWTFREIVHIRCLTQITSVNYFCKNLHLRSLKKISPIFAKSSILNVWVNYFRKRLHLRCLTRFYPLTIFAKGFPLHIRHGPNLLATSTKSFILDVRHGFHTLTVFVNDSILDVWQGFDPFIISTKGSSLDVWHGLYPLTTFAKSSILDVWHGFHPLTVFVKGSTLDVRSKYS